MTEEDIIEFFKDSENVSLLPADDLFPFEIGRIALLYPSSYYLDWVTFSLFFQNNFKDTYNILEITEKNNAKIDLRFEANSEKKKINISAKDLSYNKDKFDYFVRRYKKGRSGGYVF